MGVPYASSWPEGQMQCSKQCPGTLQPPGRDVASPEEWSSMRRRGYPTPAWLGVGPQPLMYGI